MLQALLAERFELQVRLVDELQQVVVLRRITADGVEPRGLLQTDGICVNPGVTPIPDRTAAPGREPQCGLSFQEGRLTGSVSDMSEFARFVSMIMNRAVVDETGLGGAFELESLINPESMANIIVLESSPVRHLPSFAEARRRDFGLRTETERRSVPVLHAEHVEEPTAN